MHHEYETIAIVTPELDEGSIQAVVAKFKAVITDNGAEMLLVDDWGMRKLAYPIGKHLKGHYVLYHYVADPDIILEIERRIRIDENLVRFMTVKLAENVDVASRIEAAEEARRRREEERRRAEAEAALENDYDDDNEADADADAASAD